MKKSQPTTLKEKGESLLQEITISVSGATWDEERGINFGVRLQRGHDVFFDGPFYMGVGHFLTIDNAKKLGKALGWFASRGLTKDGNECMLFENACHRFVKNPRIAWKDKTLAPRLALAIVELEAMQRRKQEVRYLRPSVADVMPCLLVDGSADFDCESFEEWAESLGYDTDSIKSLETYNTCVKIGRNVRRVFTQSEIEALRAWGAEQ